MTTHSSPLPSPGPTPTSTKSSLSNTGLPAHPSPHYHQLQQQQNPYPSYHTHHQNQYHPTQRSPRFTGIPASPKKLNSDTTSPPISPALQSATTSSSAATAPSQAAPICSNCACQMSQQQHAPHRRVASEGNETNQMPAHFVPSIKEQPERESSNGQHSSPEPDLLTTRNRAASAASPTVTSTTLPAHRGVFRRLKAGLRLRLRSRSQGEDAATLSPPAHGSAITVQERRKVERVEDEVVVGHWAE